MRVKAWEAARKPRVVVTADTPLTVARSLMRDSEESIAVIVESERTMKFQGYITWREAIQVTSHYSHLRVKDAALDHPVAYKDDDIEKIVKLMEEEKVYALPVLDSPDNPVVVGVLSIADIIRALMSAGMEPIAGTVAEVMTSEDIDRYVTYQDERVNRVWSDLVYHGLLGKIVIRSKDEPIPVGIISLREFIATGRWYFHRESERGLKTIAKVKRIMLRGAPVATPRNPSGVCC